MVVVLKMNDIKNDLLGIGLYTIPEASKLVRIPAQRIRRWVSGYDYTHKGEQRHIPELWLTQVSPIDHTLTLGFQDLMEARFIDKFVQHGVALQTIRRALVHARELLGKQHPFSTKRFQTDGRTIFAEILHDSGEKHLLDLVKSQFAFSSIITPSLYRDLDFSPHDDVLRWWPMGHNKSVVIDPSIAFGQPTIQDQSIPTATLAAAARVEGSIKDVSVWFDVSPKDVKDALDFEERLAA